MKQRGRKSSSAVLAAVGPGGVARMRRPDPPDDLGDEAAAEFRRLTAAYPADRFDVGAVPLLTQLVRHLVAARRLGQSIARLEADEDFDVALWRDLLGDQRKESTAIASLATRLRLTPQSRYRPDAAGSRIDARAEVKRPWETETDETEGTAQ